MKISSLSTQNLVERIREAQPTVATSDAQSAAAVSEAADDLTVRVEEIALDVIEGNLNDAQEVRSSVIEAIIEDRFSTAVSLSERRSANRSLANMLQSDPEFIQRVDHMLILAASRIERTHD